jgi:formylglycine-generating enzyme required for sulfatase activity
MALNSKLSLGWAFCALSVGLVVFFALIGCAESPTGQSSNDTLEHDFQQPTDAIPPADCLALADIHWVTIPSGSFWMGAPNYDYDASDSEFPRHLVELSGYEIMEAEVTEGQFVALLGYIPLDNRNGCNHPVEYVQKTEAEQFCALIGGRLPTEAEWECAARGGTGTIYFWGDGTLPATTYMNTSFHIKPIKSYSPNPFGLYDVTGNVGEWVSDIWAYDYYSNSPAANPKGPDIGGDTIARGGSVHTSSVHCRVSARQIVSKKTATPPYLFGQGFRCARDM